jgi:hypothetical protein
MLISVAGMGIVSGGSVKFLLGHWHGKGLSGSNSPLGCLTGPPALPVLSYNNVWDWPTVYCVGWVVGTVFGTVGTVVGSVVNMCSGRCDCSGRYIPPANLQVSSSLSTLPPN